MRRGCTFVWSWGGVLARLHPFHRHENCAARSAARVAFRFKWTSARTQEVLNLHDKVVDAVVREDGSADVVPTTLLAIASPGTGALKAKVARTQTGASQSRSFALLSSGPSGSGVVGVGEGDIQLRWLALTFCH